MKLLRWAPVPNSSTLPAPVYTKPLFAVQFIVPWKVTVPPPVAARKLPWVDAFGWTVFPAPQLKEPDVLKTSPVPAPSPVRFVSVPRALALERTMDALVARLLLVRPVGRAVLPEPAKLR